MNFDSLVVMLFPFLVAPLHVAHLAATYAEGSHIFGGTPNAAVRVAFVFLRISKTLTEFVGAPNPGLVLATHCLAFAYPALFAISTKAKGNLWSCNSSSLCRVLAGSSATCDTFAARVKSFPCSKTASSYFYASCTYIRKKRSHVTKVEYIEHFLYISQYVY